VQSLDWLSSLQASSDEIEGRHRSPPFFGHDSAVDAMKSTLQIGSFEAQTNNSDTGYS